MTEKITPYVGAKVMLGNEEWMVTEVTSESLTIETRTPDGEWQMLEFEYVPPSPLP